MSLPLKFLSYVSVMALFSFGGPWILRRLKPTMKKRIMVIGSILLGLVAAGIAIFELRKNPSDLVPFFVYLGMAGLCLSMAIFSMILKDRELSGPERR